MNGGAIRRGPPSGAWLGIGLAWLGIGLAWGSLAVLVLLLEVERSGIVLSVLGIAALAGGVAVARRRTVRPRRASIKPSDLRPAHDDGRVRPSAGGGTWRSPKAR